MSGHNGKVCWETNLRIKYVYLKMMRLSYGLREISPTIENRMISVSQEVV